MPPSTGARPSRRPTAPASRTARTARSARRLRHEDHLEILHALWEQHPSELFPRVAVPTLIVPARRPNATGRAAEMAPMRERLVANAAAALPNGRLLWMENTVHDIPLQRPAELAEAIESVAAPVSPIRPTGLAAASGQAQRSGRARARSSVARRPADGDGGRSWSPSSATSRSRRWYWPASSTPRGSSASRCRSSSGASSRCWRCCARMDGPPSLYLPTIQDVPGGVEELERLLALDDGDRVVFDLTNARGVLGFSLYELARRYEGVGPDRSRGGTGGLECPHDPLDQPGRPDDRAIAGDRGPGRLPRRPRQGVARPGARPGQPIAVRKGRLPPRERHSAGSAATRRDPSWRAGPPAADSGSAGAAAGRGAGRGRRPGVARQRAVRHQPARLPVLARPLAGRVPVRDRGCLRSVRRLRLRRALPLVVPGRGARSGPATSTTKSTSRGRRMVARPSPRARPAATT